MLLEGVESQQKRAGTIRERPSNRCWDFKCINLSGARLEEAGSQAH